MKSHFAALTLSAVTVTTYIPALYSVKEPVKELFYITLQLLFKNWREMEANENDTPQVLTITKRQLLEVLKLPQSELPGTMDNLKVCPFRFLLV